MIFGAFIEMIKTGLKRILWGKVDEQAPTVIDQEETPPAEAPAPKKDEKEKKPAAPISKSKKKRKRKRPPISKTKK